jgi:hypothetical protein
VRLTYCGRYGSLDLAEPLEEREFHDFATRFERLQDTLRNVALVFGKDAEADLITLNELNSKAVSATHHVKRIAVSLKALRALF